MNKQHRKLDLQYYVYIGINDIGYYNIFSNIDVYNGTEEAVFEYLKDKKNYSTVVDNTKYKGFEALCKRIEYIIRWRLNHRAECELYVSKFESSKPTKINCYLQALPNIKLITREVIYQAEQWEKARKYKNAKAGVARQI